MSFRPCLNTTVGLLAGFFAATAAFSATIPPLPTALVGSYQGLLQVPGTPEGLPFGRIEILTTTARKATGKLVLIDKKSYPFTISLATNVENTEATGSAILVKKAAVGATPAQTLLDLTLTIKADGTFDATGASTLTTLPPATFEELPGAAFKTPTFVAVKNPCPWIGSYTAAFSDPDPAGNGAPTGSGYMTATTTTAGVMNVVGKLADGTAITGALKPSQDGRHFLFLTPYTTTVGGYFVSSFQLTRRSDNRWHVANDTDWTKWKKPAYAKDKSHPAGFGPLDVLLTMAQWVAPVGTSNNVGTVMGITADKVFNFSYESTLIPTVSGRYLPLTLGLTSTNTLRVATAPAGSPSTLLNTEWAKLFVGKVDPKTGLITITVNISDSVIIPPAITAKTIKRIVTLSGVMFQLEAGDTSPIASGFGSVPGFTTTAVTNYGGFSFTGPAVVDPFVAAAGATAGNYTVTLHKLASGTLPPAGIPADGQNVSFTVAGDLKSIKFNGKVLPLVADGRPVSLLFSNVHTSTFNNVTVTLFTNTSTGAIIGLNNIYNQVIVAIPPVVKNQVFDFIDGTIVKH
ncbi:MAG: hypothetical protein V4662_06445 [Verrucomicrobiota bacterium]